MVHGNNYSCISRCQILLIPISFYTNIIIEREVFMSEKNMSLLSQSEIDALIKFLNENKNSETLSGDILSQSSINKLIELVKSIPSLDKNNLLNSAAIKADASSFFANKNGRAGYELAFKTNDNGQITIFACNAETDDIITIAPAMVSSVNAENLPETWGRCLSPNAFNCIAELLKIKYSDETLSNLKALFAENMYGSAEAVIPAFYLP